MTEIQLLLELQHLDMQIRQLEKALAELPIRKEIENLEAALETLRASLSDVNARLARIRKEQKEAEWSLKETAGAIESISGKLYGGAVMNPREIEGMQGKLRMLEAGKAQLEDRIIAHMEEIETLESREKTLSREIAEAASRLDVLHNTRDVKVSEIEAEISDVSGRREALAAKISAGVLARYEQLAKDKGGLAVAPVKDGICGGCHVVLPTFLVARARPNDQVVKCESCGRILCWVG
ncbi:MAG: zinc ribbon domain-containing protein [Betaproteobacteria bacterium]